MYHVCYTPFMNIIEAAKKIQVDRGLNDTQMAKLLGYKHRTGWARIKTGLAPANEVFKLRVWKAFTPELNEIGKGDGVSGEGFLSKLVLKIKKYL